jgi:CDP-diacylglycerol--glycerol-3-phosphate 3-phosphatidyltransferase
MTRASAALLGRQRFAPRAEGQPLTLANKLTWTRVATVPFIAAAIATYRPDDSEWLRYAAIALFCLAIVTDGLDGAVARAWNQRTKFGTFLDPLADKMLVNITFIFLAVQDEFAAAVPRWVPPVIISRDILMVVGARIAIQLSDLRVFNPRLLGKVTTTVQMATILTVLLRMPFAYKLTLVTVVLTLLSCADYLWSGTKLALAHKSTR